MCEGHTEFIQGFMKLDFPLSYGKMLLYTYRPRGKESTEVRITQKIGKGRGNSNRKNEEISRQKTTQKLNLNILAITDVFLDQKRVNVCEHSVKKVPRESFGKVPPERVQDRYL